MVQAALQEQEAEFRFCEEAYRPIHENFLDATEAYACSFCASLTTAMRGKWPRELRDMIYSFMWQYFPLNAI
ncbi:hypothetical protein M3J09_000171 [Ascochyta lentis]